MRFRVREIKTAAPVQPAHPGPPPRAMSKTPTGGAKRPTPRATPKNAQTKPPAMANTLAPINDMPGGDAMKSMFSCRICLCEAEEDNPFVTPCECAGSMQFVHIQCLQQWLRSRFETKTPSQCVTTITWKTLECELCRKPYPATLTANNRRFDLIDFPKPESDSWIVLEILSREGNQIKGLHVVNAANKSYIRMVHQHLLDAS